MNVNIYLEETLSQQLNHFVETSGKSRNAIIREAIKEWLIHHETKQWPDTIANFQGIHGAKPFETTRSELIPPSEDPLA